MRRFATTIRVPSSSYAEYCLLSTQTRYLDWDHVKKQMYKVHLPHLQAGYIAKIEYEEATDAEGQPDWIMYYTPGPNAAAEYRAFMGGGNRAVRSCPRPPSRPRTLALPFPAAAPPPAESVRPLQNWIRSLNPALTRRSSRSLSRRA